MINVYWTTQQQQIIRADYFAPIESWDEYQAAIDQSCEMAQSVSHSVYMIHNPNQVAMPSGNAIEQLRLAVQKIPPNVDKVLMIITNRISRRIAASVIYIFGISDKYKIVQSIEEAEILVSEALSFN